MHNLQGNQLTVLQIRYYHYTRLFDEHCSSRMRLDDRDPSSFTRTPAFVRCLSESQNPLCIPHRMIPLLQEDLSPVVFSRLATSICDVSVASCTSTRCAFCGASQPVVTISTCIRPSLKTAANGHIHPQPLFICSQRTGASVLTFAHNYGRRSHGSHSEVSCPFPFSADPRYASPSLLYFAYLHLSPIAFFLIRMASICTRT